MSELHPDARRALRAAREASEPTAAQLQRVQARVLTAVAAPSAMRTQSSGSGALSGKAALVWKTVVTAALIGAGAAAALLHGGLRRESNRDVSPARSALGTEMHRDASSQAAMYPDAAAPQERSGEPTERAALSSDQRVVAPQHQRKVRSKRALSAAKTAERAPLTKSHERPSNQEPNASVSAVAQMQEATLPQEVEEKSSPSMAPPSTAQQRTDTLARELELLSRAHQLLEQGRERAALLLLSDYARSYPAGVLREEALATEVRCLCKLGEQEPARSAFSRLLRFSPMSSHIATIHAACGDLLVEK